jgi:hypothetical protein
MEQQFKQLSIMVVFFLVPLRIGFYLFVVPNPEHSEGSPF